jgi:hypothetical protein
MAASTLSLVHVTEQTAALVSLYSDAGLERWHAAALADTRKHLKGYLRELIQLLEAEIEVRCEAYRLGVEAVHYLATR